MSIETKRDRYGYPYFRGLLVSLAILMLLSGCTQPEEPRLPPDAQIVLPDISADAPGNIFAHWARSGPQEMQGLLSEVDSLLRIPQISHARRLHLAWYRISPGQWSALVYASLDSLPGWEDRGATVTEYEMYRGRPVLAIKRPGYLPLYQARWREWWVWAWQPSLLQDALLAQKRGGRHLPKGRLWQQSTPFASEVVTCRLINFDDHHVALKTERTGAADLTSLSALRFFPDFLSEGYFFSDMRTPYGRQRAWMARQEERDEYFLWLPDTSAQLSDWWEAQFIRKGEMASYTHQGITVRQLLDDSWKMPGRITDGSTLRNPFVVRLPEGWLLANSRVGCNRWIDYLLAGRLYNEQLLADVPSGQFSGWATGTASWIKQLSGRSGVHLQKQETALLGWAADTLHLYPVERRQAAPGLEWQYQTDTGPVRRLWPVQGGVLVEDREGATLIDTSGHAVWRTLIDQPVQSGMTRIAEPERTIWAFHTDRQIIALDESGQLLPGFPYAVPDTPITHWIVMRGSDGYARFFWQDPGGRIRGMTSRLQPCKGWPLAGGQKRLLGHVQMAEEDVFFLAGPRQWAGYTLQGKLLWEVAAPGTTKMVAPADGQFLVLLADGRLLALTPRGSYRLLADQVLECSVREGWVFIRQQEKIAAGYLPVGGDSFRPRYRLSIPADALLAEAVSFQLFFGGSRNKAWHLYTPGQIELDGSPLPSETRPVLVITGTALRVITQRGDRVVAYRWSLPVN